MKKVLKITGIILGSLAILVLLADVFGTQLAAKIYVSKKYEHYNCTLSEFPYDEVKAPENWKTIECEGMTLKVPDKIHQLYQDGDSEVKKRFFVDAEENPDTAVMFVEQFEMEFTGLFEGESTYFDRSDIEKAMKSAGYEYPENMYEFYDFIYNVTPKDFGVIKHGKSPMFMISVADSKDTLYGAMTAGRHLSDSDVCGEVFSFETENAVGFFMLYGVPNEKNKNKYSYLVELYDKENLNKSNSVIVKSTDRNTALEIAASAEIAEE